METDKHSMCKALSIGIAVEQTSLCVMAAEVAAMLAKVNLAAISRKKYGKRPDKRSGSLKKVLTEVKRLDPNLEMIRSDEYPRSPSWVVNILGKGVTDQTFKGRRGRVVGRGELNAGGFNLLVGLK